MSKFDPIDLKDVAEFLMTISERFFQAHPTRLNHETFCQAVLETLEKEQIARASMIHDDEEWVLVPKL